MARAFEVRIMHAPRHSRHRADDAALDEIPQPPDRQQECDGDHKFVGHLQQRLSTQPAENENAEETAEYYTVRRQPAAPPVQGQPGMCGVIAELVEQNVEDTPAQQHADRQKYADIQHMGHRPAEARLPEGEPGEHPQKAQRISGPIPVNRQAEDRPYGLVEIMGKTV
jgi:hypothetical protein